MFLSPSTTQVSLSTPSKNQNQRQSISTQKRRCPIKPLLAHTYEPHRVTYPCYVQPKLNGVRALYQNGRFQSREELPFATELLAHLSVPLQQVFDPSIILDGELYVHGWPLGRILSAVTPVRGQKTEDTGKVEFHVFDVVDFTSPFSLRFKLGIPWMGPFANPDIKTNGMFKVETVSADTEEIANNCYAKWVADGFEGMMYRLGDCPYTVPKQTEWKHRIDKIPVTTLGAVRVGGMARTKFLSDKNNRTWHLLKRKDWQDDEFPFVSLEETRGDLGERGFVMWCRARNGRLFKFGSGLTQAELDHYLANPPVGRMVKGKYLVLSADGIPQNGTILAIL